VYQQITDNLQMRYYSS